MQIFSAELIISMNMASVFVMIGVIWIVQLVHYPMFAYIDESEFKRFEQVHINKISLVVVPAMLVELFSSLYMIIFISSTKLDYLNFFLLFCAWFVTFIYSIPCHKRLMKEKDVFTIQRLVKTNWLRTLLWTSRGFIIFLQLGNRS